MPALATFPLRDLVRLSAAFVDDDGMPVDPDAVKVITKDPAAVIVTKIYLTDAAVIRDDTGLYHIDINVPLAGTWYYRWESTGNGQAAAKDSFIVGTEWA